MGEGSATLPHVQPPSAAHRAVLVRVIEAHTSRGYDPDVRAVVCRCRQRFVNEQQYAYHLAQRVTDAFDGVLAAERVQGQVIALTALMRHFGPTERGSTLRSRSVYTGAQFAGWCRERAHALLASTNSGQGKPPTRQD